MLKTVTYRLYPTNAQRRLLDRQLEECRWLYNPVLEERKTACEERQQSLRYDDQAQELPSLKAERPSLAGVQAQVLQNVAVRLDLACKACLRRTKAGETPGYPRFRGAGRYDSLTFPQVPVGCPLDAEARRLRVMHVGQVKVVLPPCGKARPRWRPSGAAGRASGTSPSRARAPDPSPLPATGQEVGIGMGLTTVAMPTEGEPIAHPRCFRRDECALAGVQRRLSKAEKGTPERVDRRRVVARVHERIAWRRGDFAHQHSRRLVDTVDLIAVEDLSVTPMMHNHHLAKCIHDAAWSTFTSLLSDKAAWAGRRYVAVNPAYTSQHCSSCGYRQALPLADRIYRCPRCGLVLDRDLNAARNILRLAREQVGLGQQSLAPA